MNRATEKELQTWAKEMNCDWVGSGDEFYLYPRQYPFREGRYIDDGQGGAFHFTGGPCDLFTDYLQIEHELLRYDDNGEFDTLKEHPFPPLLRKTIVDRVIAEHVPDACVRRECGCAVGACPYELAESGSLAWWRPYIKELPPDERIDEADFSAAHRLVKTNPSLKLVLAGGSDTQLIKSSRMTDGAWPVLSPDALHGLAGEFVRLVEPHTEADPVALLASFLAEVGTLLNRGPHIILDGSRHPLLVWPVLVGRSSKSRKGTADSRVGGFFRMADSEWTRGEFRGTLSSGEGLAWAVRDASYSFVPVKEKGKFTGETQSVLTDKGIEDKRLHLVQPEFGAMLRIMARDGNSLSGVLRDAWDGKDLAPMTKNNRVRATNPHIGIAGHVTKDELLRNLTDTEMSNGFGNRFLWFAVQRSRELPFPSCPDESAMDELVSRVRKAVQEARTVGELGMTDGARQLWAAHYHALSADRPGLAGSLLGRGEAQVMRLAALYALLDGQRAIDAVHLRAGLAVWDYAEASTRMIFGDSTGNPVADAILRGVRQAGELSDTDISGLFQRHAKPVQLERAKATLLAGGLIHYETVGTAGRPRRVWKPGAKKAN